MKILVILVSHEMNSKYIDNIIILNNYMNILKKNNIVEYCGISNTNDFENYENIIDFKYKIINNKKQFSKISNFIMSYKEDLNYDWYIKIRPDITLLEPIILENFLDTAINARARAYTGPKKIINGMSVNGKGWYNNIGDCFYDILEKEIILDDQFYVFHHNIINTGVFEISEIDKNDWESEWFHTKKWNSRNINLNIIGINLCLKNNIWSGNLNLDN